MNNLSNIISVSLRSIMKNKRRNIFTMIGIIIGIASVITIMALGNGFKKTANEQFSDAGAGKNQASISFMTDDASAPKNNPFNNSDINLVRQYPGIKKAQVKDSKDSMYLAKVTNSQKQEKVSIKPKKNATPSIQGKGFNTDDNDMKEKLVVIDEAISKDIFNGESLNKSLYIEGEGFKVVGVSKKEDSLGGSGTIYLPSNTFKYYLPTVTEDSPTLQITVENGENKKKVAQKIEKELNKKASGISEGEYTYNDNQKAMKNINAIFDAITYFVAAVAGISLFIAGIGVMNVMYISVSERTEEIAIRRAFGAKSRDIEIQFLIESVILCLIGGIIGLLIGVLISSIIDWVTPKIIKSYVSIGSIILAVSVSTIIGIIFGWIPARSASKKELNDIIK